LVDIEARKEILQLIFGDKIRFYKRTIKSYYNYDGRLAKYKSVGYVGIKHPKRKHCVGSITIKYGRPDFCAHVTRSTPNNRKIILSKNLKQILNKNHLNIDYTTARIISLIGFILSGYKKNNRCD